ncbi:MAG: PEP/pyruvate-binding domain-containing protein [Thiotrichales bacterium]
MIVEPPTQEVSTGLAGLDAILDGLRIGDNVVWRVDDIEDYRYVVSPFVAAAAACERSIVYLRFGQHAPLVTPGPYVKIVRIDAFRGFEAFTRHVYQLITDYGRGAFYVFDCLSDLLSAWATDVMVGNLFRVVCPYLYELDTVAYFAVRSQAHSHRTMARIRTTTQVLIDLRHAGNERLVQPVKVWQRQSPTMFLPHRHREGRFEPVIDSSDATRLQASLLRCDRESAGWLDAWDRLFLEVAEVAALAVGDAQRETVLDRLYQVMIGRDTRMVALARKFLGPAELVEIRSRMIGSGFIGGKAAGMLLARRILLAGDGALWGAYLDPHDSFFIGSDVYYAYLVHNGWWSRIMRQRTEPGYFSEAATLHDDMLRGALPEEVRLDLERMLDHYGQYPLLVRSSSLLEDGFGNAFAGKYESVFCVNQGSPEQRLAQLEAAICRVFASTMSNDALAYRRQRGLAEQEEPMALLIQRVNGRYHDRYYLPDIAGVGVSRNNFAWDPGLDPLAGMLRLVVGLGTRAVDRIDGDHACVIALDQPHKRPFRDVADVGRYSQHDVDVLDIHENRLRTLPLRQLAGVAPAWPLQWCAELDREATQRSNARSGGAIWRVTFAPLIDKTPFIDLLRRLLHALEAAYEYPVDIEFTTHLAADGSPSINLVQCRPLQTLGLGRHVDLPRHVADKQLLFATQGNFMGGNIDQPIARVIRVDGLRYGMLSTPQRFEVARRVGRFNRQLANRDECPTLMIGPGRWGTSTPELGVPIRFADINRAAVLVEVAELGADMVPDLSFGSHFFQDLVESSIAYVALFPHQRGSDYRPGWLDALPECRRISIDGDETCNAEVLKAVTAYDVSGLDLRVTGDILSLRLMCYQRDPAIPNPSRPSPDPPSGIPRC